jgi:hypothetical protein
MLDADTNDWHERYRVWKNGDWTTDITAQPIEFTSIAMSTLYESVKDESNPGTWTSIEMAADCVGSTPNAVCGDLILGIGNYLGSNSALPVRHLGYDAEGNPTDETRNDGYASVDACYVANLWTLGADTITADPIDPPSMAKFMGLNYFDSSAPLYGVYDYRALASPGGALAILGTQATQYEGLWKIWNPPTGAGPYIPGVGSPTLIDCEDSSHNKLWIKAIEDGGVVVGERNDLYVLTNPQTIPYQVANDHGVESKLPGSDGATHKALAICRVPTGVSGQSRLVAAGTDLWVQKDGQWRLATHKPTVNPIIAVADDGVLLGSQSIWRNGNEITLDKLVETNTVQQSGQTLVRYTNLRAYAMNSKGAIVALADDKLNSGDKHKTSIRPTTRTR